MKPSQVSTFSISISLGQVAAPVITPDGGEFEEDVTVVLSTATPGAKMYYTLRYGYSDDMPSPLVPAPGEEGTEEYAGPLTLSGPIRNWVIAAVAVKDFMEDSEVVSSTYRIACPTTVVEVPGQMSFPKIENVNEWKSYYNDGIQWGPSILCVFWTDSADGLWLVAYDAKMAQINARKIDDVGTVTGFTLSNTGGFPQVWITSLLDDEEISTYIELGYYVPI